ncbi:retrovirus-related pol polyprotein from transposon RE1 [Citrus sinensis]|nr:retrovirus-related pol polyprotein from transposon RE1 [Citrus sinensis]
MSDSVSTMKSLADNLATVGKGVEEDDLISYILVGLGAEYDPVVVNITGRTYQLTLQEVFSLLLNHESRLEQLNTVSFVPEQDTNAIHDNFVQTNNKRQGGGNFHSMNTRGGSRGRGRGRTHYGKGGNNRPTCQICGKYGHSASTCYWRFNEEFSGGKQNINQASAYMAHSDEKGEHGWYFDSGTTHRITNYLSDLNIKTELKGVSEALLSENWRTAMKAGYDALMRNKTWELIPVIDQMKIVGNKWVFKVKQRADGSVERFKARLVAKGYHQTPGLDFNETFSPVIKTATIRIILSLAVMKNWGIMQVDVNNAFLNGELLEDVFMEQPEGFVDAKKSNYVCKLKKALYGLKQAPRAWFEKLRTTLTECGFHNSKSDTSMFILRQKSEVCFVLVYVDDILITGSSESLVNDVINDLNTRFALKILGPLNYFPDLLKQTGMESCKDPPTPCNVFSDVSHYRSVIGALLYVTITRPKISFVVHKLSQFMQCPLKSHWVACKRILRYLHGTSDYGLYFMAQVARSSTESEYRALANSTAEMLWLVSVLQELNIPVANTPVIWCDNIGAASLAANSIHHSRTKHIEIDVHFVRDIVEKKKMKVRYIPTAHQPADIFTKALSRDRFQKLRNKLHVLSRTLRLREGDKMTESSTHASLVELAAYSTMFTHMEG